MVSLPDTHTFNKEGLRANFDEILRLFGTIVPTGVILPYAGSAAPDNGWLLCDGAAVSRAGYPDLFKRLGTTYGAGDGSTTFNLPDLRGRVPVGEDGSAARLSASDALGNSGGTPISNMPNHAHGGAVGASGDIVHDHNLNYFGVAYATGGTFHNLYTPDGGSNPLQTGTNRQTLNHAHTISAEGTGGAMDNMPPYQVVNYIIRV